ncbi:hypothetical protein [Saprospira grandis]|uniref:Uncharacterized protein n=1 Tax=Saprospira grandis (strain Lewin) TaxID=984262 RepID=H6LAR3_SAPGL|nr:hypothetical protein [Saprospira grandis]AFC25656.1 hypothetical protein SGRA_2928 [Saprospira grandis str. Lewin]
MKIKKLTPEQVQDKSLGYKEYKKVIKALLNSMQSEHNSADLPTKYLALTNYEFADMPGKKMGLIIPGDQTASWTKLSKELLKANKKEISLGQCYISLDEYDNPVLQLEPLKGNAKKALLLKQLTKTALKGTGVEVAMAAAEEAVAEAVADASEATAEEAPAGPKEQIQGLLVQISDLNKGINLADGLQPEDISQAEELKTAIRQFALLLKDADAGLRQEFGAAFIKTRKLFKKLEEEIAAAKALEAELNAELAAELGELEEEETATAAAEETVAAPENKAEAIASNAALFEEINQLIQESQLQQLV